VAKAALSSEALHTATIDFYKKTGWSASEVFTATEERLATRLSLRPAAIAKRDGMEHLIFALGKVTDATYKLLKQILFEIERQGELSHVVIMCADRVTQADERRIKDLGVGIVLVRQEGEPISLATPKLCCFREPKYERLRPGLRAGVRNAVRKVAEEDVTVGVLDLAQILEKELEKRLPAFKGKPLGLLIREARKAGILSDLHEEAADRVNDPRIKRAHHANHATRRRVVMKAQDIVDDCLAVLFAIT